MVASPEPHQRVTRLTALDELFAHVDAAAKPVPPRDLPLTAALGLVLAADVTVAEPVPACPLSLRDGWAVRSELVVDAGPYAPVPLSPAPDWVEAGGVLPKGADAVMPSDAVMIVADVAQALAPVVPGEGVLPTGADARPEEPLRRAGQTIRAVDLAVLGSLGIASVTVRLPRVRLVPASLLHDDTDETRIPLIRRIVEADGGAVHGHEAQLDEEDLLADALVADGADAVIVLGGVGMSQCHFAVETLARVGTVAVHGFGVSPGDNAAIGSVGARPVLLLPGERDAALAVYLLVGRRLLARLTGRTGSPAGSAVLARKIVSTVGIAEVVLVRRGPRGIEPIATGHFPAQAIGQADGYIVVPPASEGYPAGTVVEMQTLP
jgi:molybdopterin biosynthesis enzyme